MKKKPVAPGIVISINRKTIWSFNFLAFLILVGFTVGFFLLVPKGPAVVLSFDSQIPEFKFNNNTCTDVAPVETDLLDLKWCETPGKVIERFDKEPYEFLGPMFLDRHFFVYQRLGLGPVTVPLKRVSGAFYTLSLHVEDDVWSRGFGITSLLQNIASPLPDASAASYKNFEGFQYMVINTIPNGVALLGASTLPTTIRNPRYCFSTGAPSRYHMNVLNSDLGILKGMKLAGAIRMAFDYIQYDYELDGQPFCYRVCFGGSASGSKFGDQLLKVDNKFQWLDVGGSTPRWVSSRKNAVKPLNLFNDDQQWASLVWSAFDDARIPIPVTLMKNVNLDDLNMGECIIHFLVAGELCFRGGHSESSLAADPIKQLLNIQTSTLQLTAGIFKDTVIE